jgi:hypothetical protein
MSRTAYHRAYYWSRISERRASARASRRKARERAAIIKIVCEAVTEARNDKPPFGGLTRTGGWFYSRDACRGVVRIVVGERDCQPPTSLLGNSGRVSNAQRTLNLHRGSQPVGARRQSGSANGNGETCEK